MTTEFTKAFHSGEQSVQVAFVYESLPAASIAFLLDYGAKQYLSDAMAMSADDRAKITEEGGDPDATRIERVRKRVAALENGTPSVRAVAERMTLEQRLTVEIATEWLKVGLGQKGKKLPKAGPDRTAMLDRFIERNADKLRAAVAKRMKELAKIEFDMPEDDSPAA